MSGQGRAWLRVDVVLEVALGLVRDVAPDVALSIALDLKLNFVEARGLQKSRNCPATGPTRNNFAESNRSETATGIHEIAPL